MTMKTQNWLRFLRNQQTFNIHLRYVYIRHVAIKVHLYLRIRFACRLNSCSGAFLASQHGSGPLSLISFLHRCNFLTESSPCSLLNMPQLSGKKSKWEWSMCILKDISQPNNMSSIKLFPRHPEAGSWTYRLWRACGSEDPQKPSL